MKEMFLEKLPKWESGKHIGTIKWKECIGYIVKGSYECIDFEVEIIDYEVKKQLIWVKYNDKISKIRTGEFIKCKFGKVLGVITGDFKVQIGQTFKDNKRDITVTDRKKNIDNNGVERKYYKYDCNRCGFNCGHHWSIKDKVYKEEIWVEESGIINGGCSCCSITPKIIVEGINDITTTDYWLVSYFQGGYDEAKLYTSRSSQKIIPICPDCGRVKDDTLAICNIYKNHSIGCICNDKVPYSEKIMFSILEQLKLDFNIQLTNSDFKWCKDYRYDFYFKLNHEQYIIEVNGKQHYEEATINSYFKSLKEEQENDKLKKELALENGIKEENYIVIDCRKSTLDWIKEHILEDKTLNRLFDLSKINWLKAEEFTLTNRIKEICEIKRNNPNLTKYDISEMSKIKVSTVNTYLKLGNRFKWCCYNPREEYAERRNILSVEIFKGDISYGKFSNINELSDNSKELFGTKLFKSTIYSIHTGKLNKYKGFSFVFGNDFKEIC